jgi:L-ascorbate metabolism protein UlaG (beta-lactamase superfamily)
MEYLEQFETDLIETSDGELSVTFLGHGTLMLAFKDSVIHVDPFSAVADYGRLPSADLVLVTHEHSDHLDPQAVSLVRRQDTEIVLTARCADRLDGGTVMANREKRTVKGIPIEAVPAYNIVHRRPDGRPYHPKGDGNGYVLTFGDSRVYVGGDTEVIPEMTHLQDIDVAFLPMNLPYTMTPEMVAQAARVIQPRVLYPYHFGTTDTQHLVELLRSSPAIEVRVRRMA